MISSKIFFAVPLIISVLLVSAACGVKNDPRVPKNSDYPRSYPATR